MYVIFTAVVYEYYLKYLKCCYVYKAYTSLGEFSNSPYAPNGNTLYAVW